VARPSSTPKAGRLFAEVTRLDLLAVTILGITFSGTFALEVVIAVVVVAAIAWFIISRLRG
jgi:hypothetical protein